MAVHYPAQILRHHINKVHPENLRRGKEKQLVANLNSTLNCPTEWCTPTSGWGGRGEGREVSQMVRWKVTVYTILG